MVKKVILLGFILVLASEIAESQKIKYKDLFLLLNAKKFDEAEPVLRTYLSNPKNSDEPNANLQMAFLFEYKAGRNDLLVQNEHLLNNCDSAVYYFEIAKGLINEKEVSKHDEYYQSYARRDLRTGKFGVNVDNIQYDIEKRENALKEKKVAASNVYYHFKGFSHSYEIADSLFLEIQNSYGNQNNLFLMADEDDIKMLDELATDFDSTRYHFNEYKKYMESFPDSKYKQRIDLISFKNLEEVAVMPVDWKQESLKLRNYKEWSSNTKSIINGEVKSIKDNISKYNEQLDKLMNGIQTDSVVDNNELTHLVDKMIVEDLKKYDEDPMPITLLNFKVSKIQFMNHQLKSKEDSLLQDQLDDVKKGIELANGELEIIEKASGYDVEQESKKYPEFFSQYGGANGITDFVNSNTNDIKDEINTLKQDENTITNRMEWAISKSDSISLKPESFQSSRFYSMEVNDTLATGKSYVTGITVGDERQSFVAFVNSNKEIDTLYTFKMDPDLDSVAINDLKVITAMDPDGNCLSGFYAVKSDTVSHLEINFIADKTVRWTNHLTLPGIISRMALLNDRSGVEIYIKKEGEEEVKVKLDDQGKPVNQ